MATTSRPAAPPAGGNPPANPARFKKANMVGWYDPGQLLPTGIDVAVSTLFGQNADPRRIESLAVPGEKHRDFSEKSPDHPHEEIWIDYAGDVGDGWDSTYAVAYYLSRPKLRVRKPGGSNEDYPESLSRGDILVFGGDEVYPVASRLEYKRRLVYPYETAFGHSDEPHPTVFAIPGNHDWYDSLASFLRLFTSRPWFAGWRTSQRLSYFAIKLPRGWWLLGTDVQLAHDIDAPQVEFFRDIAKQMQPGDRIILCNAEPHWIYAHIYGTPDNDIDESDLAFLEEKVFGRKISVFLAGDLHHYRRHATADKKFHKITAGGGGAFLHPTHGPDVDELEGGFGLQAAFPDQKTSRGLCWGNILFLLKNPQFGVLPAVLYLLTAWTAMVDLSPFGLDQSWRAFKATFVGALQRPGALFWAIALFLGFVLFTDTRSRLYRWIAGPIHGAFHLAAAFFIGWGATWWSVNSLGFPFRTARQLLSAGVAIFAGGWIAGSIIMGLYLLVSLNVFRQHTNEAFSSLKIPDWKNFLRLHIDRDGTLTIYPVGIQKVPRTAKLSDEVLREPKFEPQDGTRPELIEAPVVVS
jgi:hypothetical protein